MMRRLLHTLALTAVLLGSASAAQAQVSVGIRIGEPPPPRAYRVPRRPGQDFVWIEGYWYPQAGRYRWHDGFWARPPYPGAYWVAPYYSRGRYFDGQWEGRRYDRRDRDERFDRRDRDRDGRFDRR